MKVARVAVNYPQKNKGLLYHYEGDLSLGDIVEVPLGRRKELGCILSIDESQTDEYKSTPLDKIKEIVAVKPEMKLSFKELQLYEWMAQYYHYSLGQLIFDSIPNILKRPRELEFEMGKGEELSFELNSKQREVVDKIKQQFNSFHRYLIHGVTGSGKTAIYLQLIRQSILQGKSVLFLLPEINLTPQFTEVFAKYVGAKIYSYHSEISDSQKFQIYKELQAAKEPVLVLGVRSSVFLPVENLGLIIVDEEHDTSFKQDDRCPYNARDVASKKAQISQVPIVLGSATPSMETYIHFHTQSPDHLFQLKERAGEAFLPEIQLVDAREKSEEHQNIWPFTPKSLDAISESLSKKEQVLIFVNRLGYANYIQCRACGHQFNCPNCSVTLRYFRRKSILSCNHCEYKEPMPQECPECSNLTLNQKGFGTEKVQEVLKEIYPDNSIERFDRDEIKNFTQLEERLKEFHSGKIDIMVGTQMLSKGHNFEKVKLVVILGIDSQLNFPDFRSQEKVYQTLVQVAGRAGRYSQDGKVFVQTLNPENLIFQLIKEHSFDGFYDHEKMIRELCDCPPYKKIAMIHFSSRFQDKLIDYVTGEVAQMMRALIRQHFPDVMLLGPRPAFVEKKSNQFSWSFLLKSDQVNQLHNLLKSFEQNYKSISSITYKIDVDPYTIM